MFLNFPFGLFHFSLLPCCLSLFFFPFFDFSSSFPLNIYPAFLLSSSSSPFIPSPSLFLFPNFHLPRFYFALIYCLSFLFPSSSFPLILPRSASLFYIYLFPSHTFRPIPSFPLSFSPFSFSPTQLYLYSLLPIALLHLPSSPLLYYPSVPQSFYLIYPSSPPFSPTSLLPNFLFSSPP